MSLLLSLLDFISETVRSLLNIYWIRPETAIWRTFDINELKDFEFKSPVLDLGCGNGAFAFTLLGGRCDVSFDIFRTVKKIKNYLKGDDIYNQTAQIKPKIIKKPKMQIDFGLDHKQALLENAIQLKVYKKLVKHDLEKPLPFKDNTFNTIFSNVFYWVSDIHQLFSECHRILKDRGSLIICVPDINHRKNLIYNEFLRAKSKWAKQLDRGNYLNLKQCLRFSEWKSIINSTGFKISHHSSYMSEQFIQFCQIAMRPYSPYMIEMANNLDPRVRNNIKSKLIQDLTPLITSYIKYELNRPSKKCFHFFVLNKK